MLVSFCDLHSIVWHSLKKSVRCDRTTVAKLAVYSVLWLREWSLFYALSLNGKESWFVDDPQSAKESRSPRKSDRFLKFLPAFFLRLFVYKFYQNPFVTFQLFCISYKLGRKYFFAPQSFSRFWALQYPECVCGRGSASGPAGGAYGTPLTSELMQEGSLPPPQQLRPRCRPSAFIFDPPDKISPSP